ncbi:MAG: fibronectin type III domain-containing protein, partial [Candidatus Spechtbacterales bacterium]|nr:fibronectin type III domain-containing protein [Candidatus Spechtbacterales bacterium]
GANKTYGDQIHNVVIRDNLIDRTGNPDEPKHVLRIIHSWCSTCPGNIFENNTVLDGSMEPDNTAPTISNINTSGITGSSATITWTTNEAADSQVEFGTTTSLGTNTPLVTTMQTSHTINLSSLTADTTYYYKVKSKDSAGNLAVSSQKTFTTQTSDPAPTSDPEPTSDPAPTSDPTPTPTDTSSENETIVSNGDLIKVEDSPHIYTVKDGKRHRIPDIATFEAKGYMWENIKTVTQTKLDSIEESFTLLPEGSLIRAVGDIDVYIVKYVGTKQFKRLILSPHVFESYGHLRWEDIQDIPQSTVDAFITSNLVRAESDSRVFLLVPNGDTGTRKWIKSADAFQRLNYDWDAVYIINNQDRDAYGEGEAIE